MRLPLIPILTVILVNLLIDCYILSVIRERFHKKWATLAYAVSAIFFLIFAIVMVALPRRGGSDQVLLADMWMLYAYFSIYIPKYLFCIFSWIGHIPKLWRAHSCKFMDLAGLAVAFFAFCVMWWAAAVNRLGYQVREVDLYFDNLPEEFDGYRMVQFSDIHTGTYGNDTSYVGKIVDVINRQNADIILFTGDVVNRRTHELLPFVSTLSRLNAPDGVHSILGNHDYGDYSTWPSPQAKKANLELMDSLQALMGWNLLNNRTEYIHHGADSIALIGVENWGDPPFTTYGDLNLAYPTQSDSTFKILLTHNPAHWTNSIADNDTINIDLSLSGHTHAMQCQIGSWSPAKYRYANWGGLYFDDSRRHQLYVNIGLGTVAIPARIGATPEITVFTLHKNPDHQTNQPI